MKLLDQLDTSGDKAAERVIRVLVRREKSSVTVWSRPRRISAQLAAVARPFTHAASEIRSRRGFGSTK